MLHSSIALAFSLAQAVGRWSGASGEQPAGLSLAGLAGHDGATVASRPGWLERGLRLFGDVAALAGHAEGRLTGAEAAIGLARRERDTWRERAEAAEARAADLEQRLAEAGLTTLDLRSRLVCLHGKLATTTATERYRTMAQALGQDGGSGIARDHQASEA